MRLADLVQWEFATVPSLRTPVNSILRGGARRYSPTYLARSQQPGKGSSAPQVESNFVLSRNKVGDQAMLRIEKDSDGCVTTLRLIGRIQSDWIASIRSAMND